MCSGIKEMRGQLLAINSNCKLSKKCTACFKLGYRSEVSLSRSGAVGLQEAVIQGTIDAVVFPCSSHTHPEFNSIVAALEKASKPMRFVFLIEYWNSLSAKEQEEFPSTSIAVVHFSMHTLEKAPSNIFNYLAVTKDQWNLQKWNEIDRDTRKKIKYFFLPNLYDTAGQFTAREALEIAAQIRNEIAEALFEFPFAHDAIDQRRPEHLNWIFKPREILYFNLQPEAPINVSIIIPFYNRSKFIPKVLAQLNRQTLAKKKFEIILLDDGSTDQEAALVTKDLKEFKSLQISYFYIPREVSLPGLYTGNRAGPIRNLGIKNSRGEILLFLDSDILLPENYLDEVIQGHLKNDILLPKRVYLTKNATQQKELNLTTLSEKDIFSTPWAGYLKSFYDSSEWPKENAWKYCLTYALSVRRELVLASGGFRTNYISYGYEDLDLGYRLVQLSQNLKLLPLDVFHLYHFDGESEYTLDMDFRFFQLAITSRMFVIQNLPLEAKYLQQMIRLKNWRQKAICTMFIFLWKSSSWLNLYRRWFSSKLFKQEAA